ncbi:MAG: 16S rRNA (cytosine(1402)-N(4))-methyltransferase RsmH [Proteobacteria bacterium]|nr:16S rRNA (cytosine(1402)-N(4))-methyltransferase RsmH [Pseudomonadota bacterium]
MSARGGHIPVMLDEVLGHLGPRDGAIYIDATFGAGGYTNAILDAAACTVWAIDRDPDAVSAGQALVSAYGGRLTVLAGRFGEMDGLLQAHGIERADGVVLDLGTSSMQIDTPGRGFSFRFDGPLDMRMEQDGPQASDIVNTASEYELTTIIRQYGEERYARRVARAIVRVRAETPIETTGALAEIVRAAVPRGRPDRDRIDPATRTFQALRIATNDELDEIDRGLAAAEALLAPGGILIVVSFHSLEDKRVKDFLKTRSGGASRPSRYLPSGDAGAAAPTFDILTRRPERPGEQEVARNPRARSARLRAGRRTAAPAWTNAATAAGGGA